MKNDMTMTTVPVSSGERTGVELSRLDRYCRKFAHGLLRHIKTGRIEIVEQGEVTIFGQAIAEKPMTVEIKIHDSSIWRQLLVGGTTGVAEAYMQGAWICSDLVTLVRIILRNQSVLTRMDHRLTRIMQPIEKLLGMINRNTRAGSRRNIRAHYDLGNDFFKLMLDPSMMYSSAYYQSADEPLEVAAINKLDLICQKLGLTPDDHVLEIGTGWGGFALHAARHYGCRVTTTTISKAQLEYAKSCVDKADLNERITLLLEDYRDLDGQYDKIVSIEMIEAIGHQYLNAYFQKCSKLLKPEGQLFLQAITIRDQYYESALKEVDFIKRYIFPGGFLPSVAALSHSIAEATDMKVTALEDIGPHYAKTLKDWRRRFYHHLGAVKQLGYSDEFLLMWEFYLCYCEGGFHENYLGTVHMVMDKPRVAYAMLTSA